MTLLQLSAKKIAIMFGLAIVAVLILFQLAPAGSESKALLERLDGIFYDLRLKYTINYRPSYQDTKIVIVDIDEQSLAKEGRWPWSRRKLAKLNDALIDAGAIVIAYDVLFAEPERNPIDELSLTLGSSVVDKAGLDSYYQAMDADAKMAEAISNGDIVLGVLFQNTANVSKGKLPATVLTLPSDVDIEQVHLPFFDSFIGNVDVLQANAMGQGFINSTADIDGSIRRAALLIKHQGQLYPSLALEAARLYSLAEQIPVLTAAEGETNVILGIDLNEQVIPSDEYGRVLVPYRGGQNSYPYLSASGVLAGQYKPELEDSVVFIGTSAVGLADLRETPFGIQYPGVEVHANVFEGLIHPDIFAYRPDLADELTVIYLFLAGIALAIIFPRLNAVKMALYGSALFIVTVNFNAYLWVSEKASLPLTTPIMLCFLITIVNIIIGFFAESNQKKLIKNMFDQYVPPAHIDKMIKDPSSVSFDGERKNLSVLFSDIRSFTSISEQMPANELKLLLNQYFSPITKTILDNKGTIDKYVGDMVMAFWGAPIHDEQHAKNAILGAFSMLKITADLREHFAAKSWPIVEVGIGINTGPMNVGDMGSEFRRSYTVLGDAVNLGSRLESLTKYYGLELLVSEYTREQALADFDYRLIDKVRVKGKTEAVAIYQPICVKGKLSKAEEHELNEYNQAYATYLNKDWRFAKIKFLQLCSDYPQRKLYSIYVERIAELECQDLPDDWQGEFTHTAK